MSHTLASYSVILVTSVFMAGADCSAKSKESDTSDTSYTSGDTDSGGADDTGCSEDVDADGDGLNDCEDPAPHVAACTEITYFEDDFSDSDALSNWSDYGGTWVRDSEDSNGFISQVDVSVESAILVPNDLESESDYVVSVDIRIDDPNTEAGLGDADLLTYVDRGSITTDVDSQDGYLVALRPNRQEIILGYTGDTVGDDCTESNEHWCGREATPYDLATDRWYHVEWRANYSGSSSEMVVSAKEGTGETEQVPIISITDTTYSDGIAGLRTFFNAASYDNFVVCK